MPSAATPSLIDQQRALFDRFVKTGNTLDRTDVEQVLERHEPGKPPSYIRQVLSWDSGKRRLQVDTTMTTSAFDATRRPDFAPGHWEQLIARRSNLRVRSIGIYQLMRIM